jgi:3-isopropylmalate/(R)-2-methylmalate dehydratase small subunit
VGVLPVVCHKTDQIADGAKITLNIKKGFIEADGKKFRIEPVPEFMQGIIDVGGLVEYARSLKEVPLCTKSRR